MFMVDRMRWSLRACVLILFVLYFGFALAYSNSGKAKYHIVLDTDAALDDFRAICLFLASPDFEILTITTSDGALIPESGFITVKSLLKSFGHEGIPIGLGKIVQDMPPAWREFCQQIPWGDEEDIQTEEKPSSLDQILSAIQHEKEKVFVVCLGGLTNISQALKREPRIKDRIAKIVWYNDSIEPLSGTNYRIDERSAHEVLSADIPMDVVLNAGNNTYPFDENMLQKIRSLDSPYARRIVTTHENVEIVERIKSKHLRFWDDLLPVYFLYPDLFEHKAVPNRNDLRVFEIRDIENVKSAYTDILTSRNNVRSKVFNGFPENPDLFADDIRPYMKNIIQRYGREEWRMAVLTNEIHGHIGIYALVGVKMGLRARQYFHIGVDDFTILSYAGHTPPLSCLNDGLQVSTGGTLGHGLITVSTEPPFYPEATFTFKGRSIVLKLKDKYWTTVKTDIKKGVDGYGLDTEEYWKYIRKLAMEYWLKWDRKEIFIIKR
jgi:pyrimidine-specific ribonucleoside hydrolase